MTRERREFLGALAELRHEDSVSWGRTYQVFAGMTAERAERWMDYIAASAVTGLPIAVTLVNRITQNRFRK